MINVEEATRIAEANACAGLTVAVHHVRETQQGWYFPWQNDGPPMAGSKGIIIEKQTGRVFMLGSAFSLDRDLAAFDAGYRFGSATLVVSAVRDRQLAIDRLVRIRIQEVTPEFERGVVWRIPRALSANDIEKRLETLPCRFGPISVYFCVEALEELKRSGAISYDLEEVSKGSHQCM